jgi:TolB-like protein
VEPASVERMAFPLPDRPSIAVVPFNNMSDDPGQEFFADGITEDLITDLSKISGLFVIARNSVFSYKGKSVKIRQVAEELGVRYVLEGSVRRAGNQMRINARLIDATTGGHLWAERYDGDLTDVFALQDKVTRKIVSAFAVTLSADESEAVAHRETNNLAAYDAFLQGWAHYVKDRPETFLKAIPYFEKAIKLDPNYGRAYAALAAIYYETRARRWYSRMGLDYVESFRLAYEYLDKAKGNPSALAHAVASRMRIDNNEHDEAIAEAEQAIALDPNDPSALQQMAYTLIMSGQPGRAIDYVRRAMRFDPGSRPKYSWTLGLALLLLERFTEAIPELEAAAEKSPDETTLAPLAATYGHLGRKEEASRVVEAMEDWTREWLPGYPVNVRRVMKWYMFRDTADADLLIEGLRKAGLR